MLHIYIYDIRRLRVKLPPTSHTHIDESHKLLNKGNVGAKDRAQLHEHVSPLAIISTVSVTDLRYESSGLLTLNAFLSPTVSISIPRLRVSFSANIEIYHDTQSHEL